VFNFENDGLPFCTLECGLCGGEQRVTRAEAEAYVPDDLSPVPTGLLASRCSRSRIESVPDAPDGTEDVHPGPFKLPAESAENGVDHVAGRCRLAAPDLLKDHLAGEDLTGMAHEQFEEIEFPAGKMKWLAAAGHLPGERKQVEIPDAEHIVGENADVYRNANEQFCGVAWLEDHVVRARAEEFGFPIGGVGGLQDDDGGVAEASEPKQNVEPGDTREGQIKENQIRKEPPGAG
jgi:hypothetical protein